MSRKANELPPITCQIEIDGVLLPEVYTIDEVIKIRDEKRSKERTPKETVKQKGA